MEGFVSGLGLGWGCLGWGLGLRLGLGFHVVLLTLSYCEQSIYSVSESELIDAYTEKRQVWLPLRYLHFYFAPECQTQN